METNPKLADLFPEERQLVQSWLVEFERDWDEGKLAARVSALPPPGFNLRLPALLGLVRIDLIRSWQRGKRIKLEFYLRAFPELVAEGTVPLELLRAEFDARRRFGGPSDVAALAARFPAHAAELQRWATPSRPAQPSQPAPAPAAPPAIRETARGAAVRETHEQGPWWATPDQPADQPPQSVPAPAGPPAARETAKVEAAGSSLPSPLGGERSGVRGTHGQKPSTVGEAPGAQRTLPEQFGRYRILKKLGAGGMGTVFLAHDTQLDRQVALKVPHFTAKDDQVRQRFYREAKAAATLDHPNLCPVYDVGEIGGVLYLTMAFIEGKPLSAFLHGGKAFPQRSAALLVYKLAGALQEAHQRGVIHRDLKPANVMINQRREPVVMDFGLARRSASDARLTCSGIILGTPAYMSPEQVNGDSQAVGPASDVYSLGVILYEMLSGRLPFDGPVAAVLGQIMVQQPEPPSRHRPDCDLKLEAICLKAMAKKVEDRYPAMSELHDALGAYLRGNTPSAAPAPPQSQVSSWNMAPPPVRDSTSQAATVPPSAGPPPPLDVAVEPPFASGPDAPTRLPELCKFCERTIPAQALKCPYCQEWRKDIKHIRDMMYLWNVLAPLLGVVFVALGILEEWWTEWRFLEQRWSWEKFFSSLSGWALIVWAVITVIMGLYSRISYYNKTGKSF